MIRRTLLLAALLLAAGCGLSDYAARVSSEQDKLERFDEEAKNLGDPVKMPTLPKKEDKEVTWNVFYRPARGISDTPAAQLYGNMLAQYGGSAGFQSMYLGVATDRKEFAADVLALFPASTKPTADTVAVKTSDREFNVSRYKYDDSQSSLAVYFMQKGNVGVAVVYRAEKGGLEKMQTMIDMSLKTLSVDADANNLRLAYNRMNKKRK